MINLWYDNIFSTYILNNLVVENRVKSNSKSFLKFHASLPNFLKKHNLNPFCIKSTKTDICEQHSKNVYPIELLYFNGSWSLNITGADQFYEKCKDNNPEFLIWYPHEAFEYIDDPTSLFHQIYERYPYAKIKFLFGLKDRGNIPTFVDYLCIDFFRYMYINELPPVIDINRKIDYNFLYLNGRLRAQRICSYYDLYSSGRLHNSLCTFHGYGELSIQDVCSYLDELGLDHELFVSWFNSVNKNIEYLKTTNAVSHRENERYYSNIALELVQETKFESNSDLFLTEKTYKPILYGAIFLICGPPGTLKHLKDLGFLTFPELFDEEYDSEVNWVRRWILIKKNLDKWLNLSHYEQRSIYKQFHERLTHNQTTLINYWKRKIDII